MSTAGHLWKRFALVLDTREQGTALALFRIALGANVFAAVSAVVLPGLVPVLWLQPENGGLRPLPADASWLVGLLGGPTPTVVWSLVAVTLLASAALVVGAGSRIAAFASLQGFLALSTINGDAGGSYDPLITNALWLLVLADSDATLSLRARLSTGKWRTPRTVTAWPRWLAIAQLVVLYASSGLQKVSASWVPGGPSDALYYILQQPSWRRFTLPALWQIYPLTQAATLGVWLFEVGSPLVLLVFYWRATRARGGKLRAWSNRWRLRDAFVVAGLSMHLSIHLLMAVGPFSLVSASLYLCLLSPDEWEALGRRVNAWWRRGRASPSPQAGTDPPAG